MNKPLIVYYEEFAPLSLTEIALAKEASENADLLLLIKDNKKGVSFDDVSAMIHLAFLEEGIAYSLLREKDMSSLLESKKTRSIFFLLDESNKKDLGLRGFLKDNQFEMINADKFIAKSKMRSESRSGSLSSLDLHPSTIRYITDHDLLFCKQVKGYLNDHRYAHSKSVALLSLEIALSNHLSFYNKVYVAALLHDIGKDVDLDSSRALMKKDYRSYLDYPAWSYHQFVGAIIAKENFSIEDNDELDAICYHCTGKIKMNPIGKIVYTADKIDPLRGWNSSAYVEEAKKDYEKGFVSLLKANRDFLKEKDKEEKVPLSEECYEYYLKEKKEDASKDC